MIESLIENSFIIMIGIIITAGFTGITGYFKKRTNCLQKVADEVEDLQKRAYRIEKALIVLTKMQEDVIDKTHPELKPEWVDIVKELFNRNGRRE